MFGNWMFTTLHQVNRNESKVQTFYLFCQRSSLHVKMHLNSVRNIASQSLLVDLMNFCADTIKWTHYVCSFWQLFVAEFKFCINELFEWNYIVERVYIVRKVWVEKRRNGEDNFCFFVKNDGKSDNVQQAKKHGGWPFIWTIPFIIHSTKFEIYKIYVLLAKKLNTQVNCLVPPVTHYQQPFVLR